MTPHFLKPNPSKRSDFLLAIPALSGFGAAFYFSFEPSFLEKLPIFFALFFLSLLLSTYQRGFIIMACASFLFGSLYGVLYEKTFLNHTRISGKIYVDVVGKVEEIKKFQNPANHVEGANLVISQPILSPTKFSESKKKKSKKVEYINQNELQEIDREFLDYAKNYQQVQWDKNGKFPNPPQKISINLIKNFSAIEVNDKIAVRAVLMPSDKKEFPDDFDFELNAKMKKIGAYGFAIGAAEILEKNKISTFDQWFLKLREEIRQKILNNLKGDEAAIAIALLIGDQSQISKDLIAKIRNCGLAHLLSISGFHLSLASAIFFITTRFLLSRSEYLALNFDLKKIASIAAIFAAYFYLKIATSPLPAQRAFLMIFLVLLALFFDEKINTKRAIMTAVLILILINPLAVFSISFQLSFVAILVLGVFYEEFNHKFFPKFLRYFLEIILLSILIQIATLPFLMHSFQSLALLSFVSNVFAIPLSSFFVMPLGFLSLFLMPLGLEKYTFLAMNEGILLLEKIANSSNAHILTPQMPSLGLVIAISGLLLICLTRSHLRFFGFVLFLSSFLTIFSSQKSAIIFEKNQKFFAINDENGLQFSKKLRPSKQRQHWMNHFGETEFKILNNCQKEKCLIEKGQRILVLTKRNKISEICKNDFDVIVNLTAKYELPNCIDKTKIKIDNFDFLRGGTQFLFLE